MFPRCHLNRQGYEDLGGTVAKLIAYLIVSRCFPFALELPLPYSKYLLTTAVISKRWISSSSCFNTRLATSNSLFR